MIVRASVLFASREQTVHANNNRVNSHNLDVHCRDACGSVDHIIDSVREIGREPFLVQVSLAAPMDSSAVCRVQTSLHNYFLYLRELEARELRRLTRTSLILFVIGIGTLTASVVVNIRPALHNVVAGDVIATVPELDSQRVGRSP